MLSDFCSYIYVSWWYVVGCSVNVSVSCVWDCGFSGSCTGFSGFWVSSGVTGGFVGVSIGGSVSGLVFSPGFGFLSLEHH